MLTRLINMAAAFVALLQAVSSNRLMARSPAPVSSHTASNVPIRPNVIVVMTDDQDKIMSGEHAMPNVVEKIGRKGITYEKHFCTVAWCCPSRVNFFTGRAAHNTNVTSISPPYGGWQKFLQEGLNNHWLPVWLQDAGIETYYVGKLMNGYNIRNYGSKHHRPLGWTHSRFLVDPYTYFYHNATFTHDNTDTLENYLGQHTTEVTKEKALKSLEQATRVDKPFFMMIAPVAPHIPGDKGAGPIPPSPPDLGFRYLNKTVPRTENFNPLERSGASWVYELERLKKPALDLGDTLYQHRLQNIAGVDRMVGEMVDFLVSKNQLDNTYIIYTSDNGFHIGQHRMHPGKRCGYEEDINIPLYIRGPDVAINHKSEIFNSHTDMAPTILKMFNISLDNETYCFDGAPVPYTADELSSSMKKELINIEFWDSSRYEPKQFSKRSKHPLQHDPDEDKDPDGDLQPEDTNYGNTYKSIRLQSTNESFYYSVWCSGKFRQGEGDHEFYDMSTDSQQMHNLYYADEPRDKHRPADTYFSRPAKQLYARLDALLMILKSCKGDTCRNPWPTLFPNGEVDALADAMAEKYDKFFEGQPKVSFDACVKGHVAEMEGPREINVYQENETKSNSVSETHLSISAPRHTESSRCNSSGLGPTEMVTIVEEMTATRTVVVTVPTDSGAPQSLG